MRREGTLRGHESFDRVFSEGRRVAGTLIHCMYLLEASDQPSLRAGYAVSHAKYHAVRRNRLRRLMREAFRLESHPLRQAVVHHRVSADLVFLFRPKSDVHVERLTVSPFRTEIAGFCERIRERIEDDVHA
ncbi:MAG: ribonuclease P protein component [Bacteroidetes bacterium]|nr:ribonuclease P protein component [Bacteroidota bacterium]